VFVIVPLLALTLPPPVILPPPGPMPPAAGPAVVRAQPRSPLQAYVALRYDYPAAAAKAGAQGNVAFLLDIGPDGRVTNCAITGSTGSAALDSASCRIMRSRARFTPARDAAGSPTRDRLAGALRWTLPDR